MRRRSVTTLLALAAVLRLRGAAAAGSAELQAALDAVNAFRGGQGVRPLRLQDQLTAAARAHAEDMARRDYLSHVSKDGRTLVQRVTDAGYANWTAVGENIASGMETWHDALLGWEQSKEHRANLLNEEFQDVGLGSAEGDDGRAYWVQVFGRRG